MCCNLHIIQIFRFISINKKMNALWFTLSRAAPDLIAFTVGFVVLVAGFAFAAEFVFGSMIGDFHNFTASFSTLLRFPLGDFHYDALSMARPQLAGAFFTLYVAIVFLVGMNMIIGIVSLYFEEVHSELSESDKWKASTKTFEGTLVTRYFRTWRRIKRFFSCVLCCPAAVVSHPCVLRTKNDRNVNEHDRLSEKMYLIEQQFLRQLRQCMRLAKHCHNINLFSYCDKIYDSHNVENVYIGLHELCTIVSKSPCDPGAHHLHEGGGCIAYKLLQLYSQLKDVTMVGDAELHRPYASALTVTSSRRYQVNKVSTDT